jgi:hypothetical protein
MLCCEPLDGNAFRSEGAFSRVSSRELFRGLFVAYEMQMTQRARKYCCGVSEHRVTLTAACLPIVRRGIDRAAKTARGADKPVCIR